MPTINARELLGNLDKDDLAQQIEAAKVRVKDAMGDLRALQTLEKIRQIRSGELTRKSPTKRQPKPSPAESAPAAEPEKKTIRQRIIEYLAANGPASVALIGLTTGINVNSVSSTISQNSHEFINTPKGWDLKSKH